MTFYFCQYMAKIASLSFQTYAVAELQNVCFFTQHQSSNLDIGYSWIEGRKCCLCRLRLGWDPSLQRLSFLQKYSHSSLNPEKNHCGMLSLWAKKSTQNNYSILATVYRSPPTLNHTAGSTWMIFKRAQDFIPPAKKYISNYLYDLF